jgi:hypothetical protein
MTNELTGLPLRKAVLEAAGWREISNSHQWNYVTGRELPWGEDCEQLTGLPPIALDTTNVFYKDYTVLPPVESSIADFWPFMEQWCRENGWEWMAAAVTADPAPKCGFTEAHVEFTLDRPYSDGFTHACGPDVMTAGCRAIVKAATASENRP